jgi:hypothetical protein
MFVEIPQTSTWETICARKNSSWHSSIRVKEIGKCNIKNNWYYELKQTNERVWRYCRVQLLKIDQTRLLLLNVTAQNQHDSAAPRSSVRKTFKSFFRQRGHDCYLASLEFMPAGNLWPYAGVINQVSLCLAVSLSWTRCNMFRLYGMQSH